MDFLKEVENKLDLPEDEKSQVLKELQSHYCDLQDEYIASGMSEDEASVKAAQKMGDPADIARRTQSAHWGTTWKSAIFAVLPLLIFSLPVLWQAPSGTITVYGNYWMLPVLIIAATMLAESIKELVHNRRPVWLATWLPVSISQFIGGSISLYAALSERIMVGKEFLPLQYPEYFFSVVITNIVIWGLLSLWLYRDSKKQQIEAGIVLVLAMVVIIARENYGWWIGNTDADTIRAVITVLIIAPFVLMVGQKLFSQHPYGNAALASLFMYALYGHTQPGLQWGFGTTESSFYSVSRVIMMIIPALTVLLYVRSHSWRKKLQTVILGIMLSTGLPLSLLITLLSNLAPANSRVIPLDIVWALRLYCSFNILSIILVITPLIIYKKIHNRRPIPVR